MKTDLSLISKLKWSKRIRVSLVLENIVKIVIRNWENIKNKAIFLLFGSFILWSLVFFLWFVYVFHSTFALLLFLFILSLTWIFLLWCLVVLEMASKHFRFKTQTITNFDLFYSYMDSTDADDENICNSSLGREVMQTVTSRRSNRRVSFTDFCLTKFSINRFIVVVFSQVSHAK